MRPTDNRTTRWATAAAGVAALVVALSACGGDDATPGAAPLTTTAPGEQPSAGDPTPSDAPTDAAPTEAGPDETRALPEITVTVPSLADGAFDIAHTCEGDDVRPALSWDGVPDDAVELAIVFDDLDYTDADGRPFLHSIIAGLDPSVTGLEEGAALPEGAVEKGFAGARYAGPCPDEPHTYRWRVLALDERLTTSDAPFLLQVAAEEATIASGSLEAVFTPAG